MVKTTPHSSCALVGLRNSLQLFMSILFALTLIACGGGGGGDSNGGDGGDGDGDGDGGTTTYIISPPSSVNGIFIPGTPQTVNKGTSITFKYKADEGYGLSCVNDECGGRDVITWKYKADNDDDYNLYIIDSANKSCSISCEFLRLVNIPSPKNVRSTPKDKELRVVWDPVDAGDKSVSYNLYHSSEPGITPENYSSYATGGFKTGAKSPYSITGLTNGTTYYILVTAVVDHNEGPASKEIMGTPEPEIVRGSINDTGIDWWKDNTSTLVPDKAPVSPKGQDADVGRDALARENNLVKVGSGAAGFDFTKICNSGDAQGNNNCPINPTLGDQPNQWGCTRDNYTNLMWEIKTTSGLHNIKHTYNWYNPDENTNGGYAGKSGEESDSTCEQPPCDTNTFIAQVNSKGLCGASNWRLPTPKELFNVNHFGYINKTSVELGRTTYDANFFPGLQKINKDSKFLFWTSSSRSQNPEYAWVMTAFGQLRVQNANNYKDFYANVRLVSKVYR